MANTRCFQYSCYYAFSIGSKESTWAYSWTWRHNVALSQTLIGLASCAVAPKRQEEEEEDEEEEAKKDQ